MSELISQELIYVMLLNNLRAGNRSFGIDCTDGALFLARFLHRVSSGESFLLQNQARRMFFSWAHDDAPRRLVWVAFGG